MTRTLRIELSPPLSPYCSGKGGGHRWDFVRVAFWGRRIYMCAVCGAVVKA